jgi:hypothetical protein
MDNNKKKKLRKIIVNDKLYYWLASHPNCDGDYGIHFRIYYNIKIVYDDVLHGETIIPSFVKEIIIKNNI